MLETVRDQHGSALATKGEGLQDFTNDRDTFLPQAKSKLKHRAQRWVPRAGAEVQDAVGLARVLNNLNARRLRALFSPTLRPPQLVCPTRAWPPINSRSMRVTLALCLLATRPATCLVRGLPGRSRSAGLFSAGRRATTRPRLNAGLLDDMAAAVRGVSTGGGGGGAPTLEFAPVESAAVGDWDSLKTTLAASPTFKRMEAEAELRATGAGPAHTDNKLRLFGKSEGDVRVTLYRDHAGWCPYCQKVFGLDHYHQTTTKPPPNHFQTTTTKATATATTTTTTTTVTPTPPRTRPDAQVWLLLEEKQIPFKIEKVPMRSYGDKPEWFLRKVPSGLLPVIELDGEMITESLVIMQILDQVDNTKYKIQNTKA